MGTDAPSVDGLRALRALAGSEPPLGPPRYALLANVLGPMADDLLARSIERHADFDENERPGNRFRHGWSLRSVPEITDPISHVVAVRLDSWCRVFDIDVGAGTAASSLEVADVAVTAHRDGDFLTQHRDDGKDGRPNGRVLSFVYWLHRRPSPFSGGELRLCGWADRDGHVVPAPPAVDLEPRHDTLVVYPSSTMHEVFPVRGGSSFADARFAVTGFVRRR